MDEFQDILKDARELVSRAGRGRKGVIAVSPEVAALLDNLDERLTARTAGVPAEIAPAAPALEPIAVAAGDGAAGDRLVALAALAEQVKPCTRCRLCETRTQTVFGDGNPFAQLVFVGEAPGESEDRQGKPFVGRAGQLLTDIIVKGMKIRREDVYICNVIKCRPPENRNPSVEEVAQCEPYLIRQLELIKPKVICALGSYAAQCLLKSTESVGRMRGKWHSYQGIPLRVTYHPAYLLRNPEDKKKTWEDIQEVMRRLGMPTAPSGS